MVMGQIFSCDCQLNKELLQTCCSKIQQLAKNSNQNMQILEGTFLTFPLIPLMQLGLLDNVKMYINRKALCKLYRVPCSNTSACATVLNCIAPECTLYCYQWHRTGHLYRGGVNWPKLFRPEAASQLGKFIKAWIDIISDLVHINTIHIVWTSQRYTGSR